MGNVYFYFKVGNRDQFYQENLVDPTSPGFTVNSRVPYKPGRFTDTRGILVGDVRLPSDFNLIVISLQTPDSSPQFTTVRSASANPVRMPQCPPYPFEFAIRDANSDSGWSFWQLRYGVPPTLSTRNQSGPSLSIPVLSDSGTGLDPASNLGKFSKVGGYGWRPDQYEYRYQPVYSFPGRINATGFTEQKSENPAQADSHPGYNNLQAYVPSTLVNQRMRGIFNDTPAKLVAANVVTQGNIEYYGAAPGQIPSSPAGIPSPFPPDFGT